MPTIEQIRAARALLGWNQETLAQASGLSQTGVARIENGTNHPNSATLEKIRQAFDKADIEFLDSTGVRKKTGQIRVLKGKNALKEFLDDVYDTALEFGTPANPLKIYLSNVQNDNWLKWMGEDEWKSHKARMVSKKDLMDLRIIVKENDWHFPAIDWSKYKWFPEKLFNTKSFYSYHDRLAFLNFMENDVEIMVMKNKEFAEGFRILYEIAWDEVAFTPPSKK